jgi:hypothetical protein
MFTAREEVVEVLFGYLTGTEFLCDVRGSAGPDRLTHAGAYRGSRHTKKPNALVSFLMRLLGRLQQLATARAIDCRVYRKGLPACR